MTSTASILLLERVIYIRRRWHVRRPSSSYLHAYSGGQNLSPKLSPRLSPRLFRQDSFAKTSFAKTFATAAHPPRPPRTCTSRAVLKSTGHSAVALLEQFFYFTHTDVRASTFPSNFRSTPSNTNFFRKDRSYIETVILHMYLSPPHTPPPPPRPRPSLFLWLSQNIDYKQRASHPNCTTYINYYQIIMIGDV